MPDKDVVFAKAASIQKCLRRLEEKRVGCLKKIRFMIK